GSVVRFDLPGLGIAGVGSSPLFDTFILPVEQSLGLDIGTGLAVTNRGLAGPFTMTLRSLGGGALGTGVRQLNPGGHLGSYVNQLIPGLPDSLQATLEIKGSPLAATALQLGTAAGQFTALPVIGVVPLPPSRPLYFAQFGNGGDGFSSSVFLVNPSGT